MALPPAFCVPPPPCVPSIYLLSYPIPPCTPAPVPIYYPPPPQPPQQIIVYPPPPCTPCPPACKSICGPQPSNCCQPCQPSNCCNPCTPSPCCNPCQSSCRPQTACCPRSNSCCPQPIVCMPIRLQANIGRCGGQRSARAKRPTSQKAIEGGDPHANYNNCNFYMTNMPKALMGGTHSGDTDCSEEDVSSECTEVTATDECTSTGIDDEDEWCDEEEDRAPVVQTGRGPGGYRGSGQSGGYDPCQVGQQQPCCFPPPGCCFPFPFMFPFCTPGMGMFGGGAGGGGMGGSGPGGGVAGGYGGMYGGRGAMGRGRGGRGRGGGDPCAGSGRGAYGRGRGGYSRGGGPPGYGRGGPPGYGRGGPGSYGSGGNGSGGSGGGRPGPYPQSYQPSNYPVGNGPIQPSNYPLTGAPTGRTANTKSGPSKSCLQSTTSLHRGKTSRLFAKSSGYRPYSYSNMELTQKSTAYMPDNRSMTTIPQHSYATMQTRSAGVGASGVPSYAGGGRSGYTTQAPSYAPTFGGGTTKAYSEPDFSRRHLDEDSENLVPVYRTSTQTRLQIVERPNEPSEIKVIQRPVQEIVSYQRVEPTRSKINLDVVTEDMNKQEPCIPKKKKKKKCFDPCKPRCPVYHTRRLHRLCSFTKRRKRRLSQIHKPMFCYKAPPCPIRETMASILRKKPPACCGFHEQEVPAFHEYCETDACPDTNRYPLLTRELSPLCHEFEGQQGHHQHPHHNPNHDHHHDHHNNNDECGEEGAMEQQHHQHPQQQQQSAKGHGKCVEKRGAKRKLHHR